MRDRRIRDAVARREENESRWARGRGSDTEAARWLRRSWLWAGLARILSVAQCQRDILLPGGDIMLRPQPRKGPSRRSPWALPASCLVVTPPFIVRHTRMLRLRGHVCGPDLPKTNAWWKKKGSVAPVEKQLSSLSRWANAVCSSSRPPYRKAVTPLSFDSISCMSKSCSRSVLFCCSDLSSALIVVVTPCQSGDSPPQIFLNSISVLLLESQLKFESFFGRTM